MKSLIEAMPSLILHRGVWEGRYRHLGRDGELIDEHVMTTRCEFPEAGLYAYVQHNHLRWDDGRELKQSFGGVYRDGLIWWETDRFAGYGWQTREDVVMLRLDYKDDPGLHFIEMISIATDGETRARTWQWFRNGTPFKRTLCDEWRISGE